MGDGREIWSDLITPERAAKGDLTLERRENAYQKKTYISHAQARDTTLLHHFIERGVLDDLHGYYALVFADLSRQFFRRVDYAGNMIYAGEFFSTCADGLLETLYLRVCRAIGRRNERAVKSACQTVVSPAALNHLPFPPAEYRASFDALVRAIDEQRKIACADR